MSDDANTLIQHYQYVWQQQANFRTLWNTIAQFVMPAWDNFIGEFAEGINRNTRIFDATAIHANERFAAAMEAMLTPRSQVWHKLEPEDESLEDSPAVRRYLDALNKLLFSCRYHPEANFASQTDECYMSLGAFGNDLLYIDEVIGRCLRYRSVPLSEVCWAQNHQGYVDTIFRKFKYTAKQAIDHWKGKARVPTGVQTAFAKNPYTELEFLHVIRPSQEWQPGAYGDKAKRYECWYIYLGDKSVIEKRGYRTFPCAVGRYRVAPRETYGRGPMVTCFPDVRTANEMVKTHLRAGQKAVDPPILLAEESILQNFNQRAGANNFGMMTMDGKPLAMPFESKANFEIGKEMLADTRKNILDASLNTLWEILTERVPGETATAVLMRAQEKGEMVAPIMGRQQSEFLGQCITREIDVLSEAGQLESIGPPPAELLRSGKSYKIVFTSPLARALHAEEGTAIMSFVQDLASLAQLDQSTKFTLDYHAAAREMANIRGVPAKLILSEEEVTQLLEHAAEQQQQAAGAQAAPQAAAGLKNVAQAVQALSSAGGAGAGAGAPAAAQ